MDNRFDRIDQRLDDYNQTLVRLTVTVEEHVRRTDAIEKEIKPIKKHVELMNAVAKVISLGVAAALAAKSLGLF